MPACAGMTKGAVETPPTADLRHRGFDLRFGLILRLRSGRNRKGHHRGDAALLHRTKGQTRTSAAHESLVGQEACPPDNWKRQEHRPPDLQLVRFLVDVQQFQMSIEELHLFAVLFDSVDAFAGTVTFVAEDQ